MNLKEQLVSTALGLVGLAVPAALINYYTNHQNPSVVLLGVLVASLAGYAFGARSVAQAYEKAYEKEQR